MRIVTRAWMVMPLLVVIGACQSPTSGSHQSSAQSQQAQHTYMVVAQRLYTGLRVPADFYQEHYDDGAFYSIDHLKHSQLTAYSGGDDYFLCSDDFTEALDWSEQAAHRQPVYYSLTDNRDTDAYFEFTRVHPDASNFIQLVRVYKCAYLQPASGADDAWRITATLNASLIRDILEYRWWFSAANNVGYTVLAVTVNQTDDHYELVLQQARLLTASTGACDEVELFSDHYQVAANGEIHVSSSQDGDFQARLVDGVVSLCSASSD